MSLWMFVGVTLTMMIVAEHMRSCFVSRAGWVGHRCNIPCPWNHPETNRELIIEFGVLQFYIYGIYLYLHNITSFLLSVPPE